MRNVEKRLPVHLTQDSTFKAVFGHESAESKEALKGLIEAFIKRKVKNVKLMPNEYKVGIVNEKNSLLDVVAELDDGTRINVEMQSCKSNEDLAARLIFYSTRLFQSQDAKGLMYDELKETYSIIFTDFTVFEGEQTYHQLQFRDENGMDLETMNPKISIHVAELRVSDKDVSCMTTIERYSYCIKHYNDEDKQDIIKLLIESEGGLLKMDERAKQLVSADLEDLARVFVEIHANENSAERNYGGGFRKGRLLVHRQKKQNVFN